MRYLIFLLLGSYISFVAANDKTNINNLTLDQAIVRVLENNPLLIALDYESKAAAARIRSAWQSKPYSMSVDIENFANSGIDNTESTLSLSKVLERGDKSVLRGELEEGEALLLQNKQDAQRLDLLAETTKRFLHIVTFQEQYALARESLKLASKTLDIVEKRVRLGKAPRAELQRARMNYSRRELELDHVEHELAVSMFKLATMWGGTEVKFKQVEADLFSLSPLPTYTELQTYLKNNPELARFATEKRIAVTQIELAKSREYSDVRISGGVRYFSETEDTAFVLSVDIPLGTTSRAEPFIEEAQMQSLSREQQYQYQLLVLERTLFELYQEATHASEVVEALTEKIIPQAELVLSEYEKGYRHGRYSIIELVDAQRNLIDVRLEAVMAATKYHSLRIEIDRLTGAGLSTGVYK